MIKELIMIDNIIILINLKVSEFEKIDLSWKQIQNKKEYRFNFKGKFINEPISDVHYFTNSYNNKVLVFKYFKISEELIIYGSWNKFIRGNNIETISLEDVIELKETIEKVIQKDISDCYVAKLEFGHCFVVNHKPRNYLQYFYDHIKPNWKTTMYEDCKTLIFGTQDNKITYYDKVEELKAKKSNSYSIQDYEKFKGFNIIRMEFKSSKPNFSIFNSISSKNSRRKIKVSDLLDKSFWNLMLSKLELEYRNTLKSKVYNHKQTVETPGQAKDVLAAIGYNKLTESGMSLPSMSTFGKDKTKKDNQKYNNDRYRLNSLYNQYSTSELVKTETARVREFNEIFKNVISILRSTLVA